MSELRFGQSKEYLDKKAADENLIVFLPNDNEVFLDLDNPNREGCMCAGTHCNSPLLHHLKSHEVKPL